MFPPMVQNNCMLGMGIWTTPKFRNTAAWEKANLFVRSLQLITAALGDLGAGLVFWVPFAP